jgi:hypothetical protein
MMLTGDSANRALDLILETLCLELTLSREQHARAARAYETVGNLLSDATGMLASYDPRVFPQGSIPQGTALRPRQSDQFDADGVCLLREGASELSPNQAYQLVLECIRSHGTYRDRVTPQDRCLRIEYEGQLHLDIIPAIPSAARTSAILIPSRSRNGWQLTDPEGFASWFQSRCVSGATTTIGLDAEPMPAHQDPTAKAALQRVVQLLKRRRDVFFQGTDAPKSILLSALAGLLWNGSVFASDGLIHVLDQLATRLPVGDPPRVMNPVNPSENLARHWLEVPSSYAEFREFVHDFRARMRMLLGARGLPDIAEQLRALFHTDGSGAVERAVHSLAGAVQRDRNAGVIRAVRNSPAAHAVSSISIPRNNFFGS